MKIAIDARMYQESGIGRYIRNLINQLQKLDEKNEYYILLKKEDFNSLIFNKNFKKILADFNWYGITEQINLPKILYGIKPDLVHFPHFNAPIFYKGKFVVTIHDLIHQHFQMRKATTLDPLTYKIKQLGYKGVFKNAVSKSKKILVPSNYVKNLLTDGWHINSEKIIITPEAVDDKITTAVAKMSTKRSQEILENLQVKIPFIFYLGNAHPHKNVEGLIKVFLELRKKYQDLRLVLSGNDHYFWEKVKKEVDSRYQRNDRVPGGIIFTGSITDEQLVALYKNAKCFILPSFEEGFGIPLLESMSCGCAVVCSNVGSLPEVGGDAAIYFDPYYTEDMVEKISQVLNSEKIREDLISKGLKRYKEFGWEKLAKQTLEVYKQCVLL